MLALIPLLLLHGLMGRRHRRSRRRRPGPVCLRAVPLLVPVLQLDGWDRVSTYIKSTTWVFPLVETIHIMALAMLLGSLFLIDLRLLGIAVRRWSPAQIVEQVHSFINWSIVIILITGAILFTAEPRKLFDSAAFGPKMILLALAIIFQYTLYPRVRSMQSHIPIWGRLMALVSLGLWFGVAVCGRAIGFV